MNRVLIGIERFCAEPPAYVQHARLGLLANPASICHGYRPGYELLDQALPGKLKVLFGPQHGFTAEKQDNMVESGHSRERNTGRPIFSLYSETRAPKDEWYSLIDVLLVDLVDVGTRVYTFAHTLSHCLEVAARTGIKVVVLDRPNPIGGAEIEGNILQPDCRSFVGRHPIPMRHGLTIGELALLMADEMTPRPELEVVSMTGWQREMYFDETGLEWVLPSPNMPDITTAWIYPGQVIWEGTNISEGRGTTRPFHFCGAPFLDSRLLKAEMEKSDLPGVYFRSITFEPMFHKFRGRACEGLEIHPMDRTRFKPYLTSITLLEIILKHYPEEFAWKEPPYEYEYERRPIDLILGDKKLRESLENGATARDLEQQWLSGLVAYANKRVSYFLYD